MTALLARILHRTIHISAGWHCTPCHINAGDPSQPFATAADAEAGFTQHITDSHGGVAPDGAYVDEFTWHG